MNWDLIVDSSVKKILKRIPHHDAKRLYTAIHELSINPFTGDIEKMEGEKDTWRRRVGNYRIIYEIRKDRCILYVSNVRRRTSNTY